MDYTKNLVSLHHLPKEIQALRADALARGIPVADDETMNYLLLTARLAKPKKILEIGTAVGLSATSLALAVPNAKITTIEFEEDRYIEAKKNFARFGLQERITAHLGDAGEILPLMDGEYDFIFLDGPKAQYLTYLPELKRLLCVGGTLFSDDVLLYGWVDGRQPTPWKRHVLVDKIRAYLTALSSDKDFVTSVLDVGDGVAVSVLIHKEEDL